MMDALDHAQDAYPAEACGMVVVVKGRKVYLRARNISGVDDQFAIHPEDWADAEEMGEIVEIVHSHPNGTPAPSDADRLGCERSGLPWTIIGWPGGAMATIRPEGWKAPLVGRGFSYGILDCYTLVSDYYRETHGIELPQVERRDGWEKTGATYFLDWYERAGFRPISYAELREGDAILFAVFSPTPNHCAVYLGDNLMLHHGRNRLSSRDFLGGYYLKTATHFLRHRDLECATN